MLLTALKFEGLDKIKMRQHGEQQRLDDDYFLKLLNFISSSVDKIWSQQLKSFVKRRRSLESSTADFEAKYAELVRQRVIVADQHASLVADETFKLIGMDP